MHLLWLWWGVSPEVFGTPFRWYSLCFVAAFALGHRLSVYLYKKAGAPEEWVDRQFTWVVLATIVGARLGHVIFYDPGYYFTAEHWVEIFKIWEGGLASHGATAALILTMYLNSKYITKKPMLWGIDKIVVIIALAAFFIRLGNLANSEIVGVPTSSKLGFVFFHPIKESLLLNLKGIEQVDFVALQKDTVVEGKSYQAANMRLIFSEKEKQESVLEQTRKNAFYQIALFPREDANLKVFSLNQNIAVKRTEDKKWLSESLVWGMPRYPAQLFEALFYLSVFILIWFGYTRWHWDKKMGFTSGLFLILVFGFRFIVEYWKEVQEAWEKDMLLKQGQMLSIPFILIGIYFMLASFKTKNKP